MYRAYSTQTLPVDSDDAALITDRCVRQVFIQVFIQVFS